MISLTLNPNVNSTKLLQNFNEDEQSEIRSLSESIDLTNDKSILSLGSDISRQISTLNRTVLSSVKTKDLPEIESMLPELQSVFNEVNGTTVVSKKQPNWISKLLRQDPAKDFMTKFENAESVVSTIQNNLQRIEMELRKDIELEDTLGLQNIAYIRELEKCITAMKLRMQEEAYNIEKKAKETNQDDIVALQLLEEEKDRLSSLDKQIFWLEQQRLLAIQTLPILRNLKNNNKDMVRQISMTVQQSIPAWEQSIIIAFHIQRQQSALRVERAVHEMTNKIVLQNCKLLKENSVEIINAVQNGMIDLETFQEANRSLIETSRLVVEAKNNAVKNRRENIQEYRRITESLLRAQQDEVLKLANKSIEIAGELNA